MSTAKCIGTYEGHTDAVLSIDIVNIDTDRLIITGGADGMIKISSLHLFLLLYVWRAADLDNLTIPGTKAIMTFAGHKKWIFGVKAVGTILYSASTDETLRAWDLKVVVT